MCWSLFQAFTSATLLKRDSNTGVFLWILRNFLGYLSWRTSPNGWCRKIIDKNLTLKLTGKIAEISKYCWHQQKFRGLIPKTILSDFLGFFAYVLNLRFPQILVWVCKIGFSHLIPIFSSNRSLQTLQEHLFIPSVRNKKQEIYRFTFIKLRNRSSSNVYSRHKKPMLINLCSKILFSNFPV